MVLKYAESEDQQLSGGCEPEILWQRRRAYAILLHTASDRLCTSKQQAGMKVSIPVQHASYWLDDYALYIINYFMIFSLSVELEWHHFHQHSDAIMDVPFLKPLVSA